MQKLYRLSLLLSYSNFAALLLFAGQTLVSHSTGSVGLQDGGSQGSDAAEAISKQISWQSYQTRLNALLHSADRTTVTGSERAWQWLAAHSAPAAEQPQPGYSQVLGRPLRQIEAPGALIYAFPARFVDAEDGAQVLWQRDARQARPPASLAKLMSLLLVEEFLSDGAIPLDELRRLPPGGAAAQRPFDAAVAGLIAGREYSWAQLLSYAIIASANDAIYALAILLEQVQAEQIQAEQIQAEQIQAEQIQAEQIQAEQASANGLKQDGVGQRKAERTKIGQTERQSPPPLLASPDFASSQWQQEAIQRFVARMNRRADELGLHSAHFVDPDGWSEEDRISPMDMARLAAFYRSRIRRSPRFEAWHRQPQVELPGRLAAQQQGSGQFKRNTNLLLPYYPEVEGLKTGFTYAAGFNFTALARRGDWYYVAVIMGLRSPSIGEGLRRRAAEAEVLLDWGLRNFTPLPTWPVWPASSPSQESSPEGRLNSAWPFTPASLERILAELLRQSKRRAALLWQPDSGPGLFLNRQYQSAGQDQQSEPQYPAQTLQLYWQKDRLQPASVWDKENGDEKPVTGYGELWLQNRAVARFALYQEDLPRLQTQALLAWQACKLLRTPACLRHWLSSQLILIAR